MNFGKGKQRNIQGTINSSMGRSRNSYIKKNYTNFKIYSVIKANHLLPFNILFMTPLNKGYLMQEDIPHQFSAQLWHGELF
jgi:hypothetical protein